MVGDLAEQEGSFQEWAAVGETPNLAARLQNLTPPGCIVVSASTHDLADRFDARTWARMKRKVLSTGCKPFKFSVSLHGSSRFEQAHARGNRTPLVGRAWLQLIEGKVGRPSPAILRPSFYAVTLESGSHGL